MKFVFKHFGRCCKLSQSDSSPTSIYAIYRINRGLTFQSDLKIVIIHLLFSKNECRSICTNNIPPKKVYACMRERDCTCFHVFYDLYGTIIYLRLIYRRSKGLLQSRFDFSKHLDITTCLRAFGFPLECILEIRFLMIAYQ